VSADCDGAYLAESYRERLPEAEMGRLCVRKRSGDVDLGVAGKPVRPAAAWEPPAL
jgi:hypothetical protein